MVGGYITLQTTYSDSIMVAAVSSMEGDDVEEMGIMAT